MFKFISSFLLLLSCTAAFADPSSLYEDETCKGLAVGGWTYDPQGWASLPVPSQVGGRDIYVSSQGGVNDPAKNLFYAKTTAEGLALLRKGSPDQIRFNRGESFDPLNVKNLGGASQAKPQIIGAYGVGPRPLLKGSLSVNGSVSNLIFTGLHFQGSFKPNVGGITVQGLTAAFQNILFENVVIDHFSEGLILMSGDDTHPSLNQNITIRRSQIFDNWGASHSQGIYAEGNNGLTVEESFFDHNGFNQRDMPFEGGGATIFAHNFYNQTRNKCLIFKNNITADAASHGLQARAGGVIENNLFIRNALMLSVGDVAGGSVDLKHIVPGVTGRVVGNSFVDAIDINKSTPRDGGVAFGNIKRMLVSDNLILGHSLGPSRGEGFSFHANMGIGLHDLMITGNRVLNISRGMTFSGQGFGNITVKNGNVLNSQGKILIGEKASGLPLNLSYQLQNDPGVKIGGNWFSNVKSQGSSGSVIMGVNLINQPMLDPSRSLGAYLGSASLNNEQALGLLVSKWKQMDRSTWDPKILGGSISQYLRDGFKAK